MQPSRRFLISLAAGTTVGVAWPTLVFFIGWFLDRSQGKELAGEALGLVRWAPLLGLIMGCAFWFVRFRMVPICLGNVSDFYPHACSGFHSQPLHRRFLRRGLFWGGLGALFGILTFVMFATCMWVAAIASMVYQRAAGAPVGMDLVQIVATTVLEFANSMMLINPFEAVGILLFFGGFPGILIWTLLLVCLRSRKNMSDSFSTPPVPETDPVAAP